jgi:hypothetical protein
VTCFEGSECEKLTVQGCADTTANYYVKGEYAEDGSSESECDGRVFTKVLYSFTNIYMYAYPPYWVLGTSCGDPAGSASTYAYAELTSSHPLEGTPGSWECKNGGGFEEQPLDISCTTWPCKFHTDP